MKVANLKPVKKSKSLVIKKRPKKDYESLLPFKYFCNQCSFKSKRQSHYSKVGHFSHFLFQNFGQQTVGALILRCFAMNNIYVRF